MSEGGTEQPVKDALQEPWRPCGENVTDEVHEAIENNLELKDRHCAIGRRQQGHQPKHRMTCQQNHRTNGSVSGNPLHVQAQQAGRDLPEARGEAFRLSDGVDVGAILRQAIKLGDLPIG